MSQRSLSPGRLIKDPGIVWRRHVLQNNLLFFLLCLVLGKENNLCIPKHAIYLNIYRILKYIPKTTSEGYISEIKQPWFIMIVILTSRYCNSMEHSVTYKHIRFAALWMVTHAQTVLLDIISTVARHVLVSDQELPLLSQSSPNLTIYYLMLEYC